ncbi:unnamed protein product [Fusarium venenatum]|uniref:Uncharacterized protein n=1 Tax=Fusarium venenatum TaxID=56646 RepID=A0A2L2TAB4_9HYPO|nr:uncharacterized protein FVRRES_07961 [Fusarium venenatum]KAH6964752.1 hypothetical protein EDB82DRAFT_479145 [Fusarium venenatum]CEI67884.1 unnamed protein product [Fusarium venenatum]
MSCTREFQGLHIETDQCHQLVAFGLDMRELTAHTVETTVKEDLGSLLSRLVRRPKSEQLSKVSATNSLAPYVARPQTAMTPEVTQYPFLTYAKENWFKHTVYLYSSVDKATWILLGRILSGDISYPRSVPWEDESLQGGMIKNLQVGTYSLSKFVCVYAYARRLGNWGFCCRAFMLLAEDAKKQKDV